MMSMLSLQIKEFTPKNFGGRKCLNTNAPPWEAQSSPTFDQASTLWSPKTNFNPSIYIEPAESEMESARDMIEAAHQGSENMEEECDLTTDQYNKQYSFNHNEIEAVKPKKTCASTSDF